jgi:hypothetical protein
VRVKVALLADYSNVSREGKLNILGIFDTIYAPTFPTTHAHMQLVIRFEGGPEEAGTTRQLEIQFQAQDGAVLFRLPGTLGVQRGEVGELVRADHILTLNNVTFEHPGRYAFQIVLDGRAEATVPLRVEQIPARH